MVEYNVIAFICYMLAACLNGLVKDFVHTVYVRFGGDYRSKIL